MKKRYTIIVLVGFLLAQQTANTQNSAKYDSLKQLLPLQKTLRDSLYIIQSLVDYTNWPDTTAYYFNKLLEINNKLKLLDPRPYLYISIARKFAKLNQYNSAIGNIKEAVDIFDKQHKVIYMLLLVLRIYYNLENNREDGLNYYRQKLEYYKINGPIENTIACYHAIAGYYFAKKSYNKAIFNYLEAAKASKDFDHQFYENEMQVIGGVYEKWGNDERAIYYFKKIAIGRPKDFTDSSRLLFLHFAKCRIALKAKEYGKAVTEIDSADLYTNIKYDAPNRLAVLVTKSLVYIDMKRPELALPILVYSQKKLDSLNYHRISNLATDLEQDYAFYKYYRLVGDNNLSEKYLIQAVGQAEKENYNEFKLKYLKELASFYESIKMPLQALDYYQKYVSLLDSVNQNEEKQKMAQAEIDEEDEKQQERINTLKLESSVQAYKISRRNSVLGWLIVVVLLISGLTVFIYRQLKANKTILAELRKAQEKLVQSQKQLKAADEMKSRLFSNITHEFRTPLSLIIGPAGQMLAEKPSAAWKQQIGLIDRNARRMLQLINQLLDITKLEAGSMKLYLSSGNLNRFLEDETESFKTAAIAKNIRFDLEMDNSDQNYLFDAEKIHAILSNLLSNALKFTPVGGAITTSLAKQEADETHDLFRFTVADTGIGIVPEKLPFIFDRFYQVENSNTRGYEGTGIGLALAKELTAFLGGSLSVESKPSIGSTFTFDIKLAKAVSGQTPAHIPVEEKAFLADSPNKSNGMNNEGKPLILVVEDNRELKQFITQIFYKDYRVITASNGKEGLTTAKEEIPDLIISDLMMPEMDGRNFCSAIKRDEATSHVAFIMLTAKTSPENIIENLQNRADDYITKPFMVEELRLRVENIIKRQESLKLHNLQQLKGMDVDGNNKEAALKHSAILDPFLEKLYAIIEEYLDDTEFSIEKLATKAAVSPRTLGRKLSALAGLTPAELIKQYRLKKACILLRQGKGVAETAYMVGYGSPAHFSTMFKEVFGVAPSEY